MRMEIERRDVLEQSKLVNVPECGKRRDLLRAFDRADFGHCREAIFHGGGIALGFPRVTPRPVDAQAALARRVSARDVVLVVGACWGSCAHGCSLTPFFFSELMRCAFCLMCLPTHFQ